MTFPFVCYILWLFFFSRLAQIYKTSVSGLFQFDQKQRWSFSVSFNPAICFSVLFGKRMRTEMLCFKSTVTFQLKHTPF